MALKLLLIINCVLVTLHAESLYQNFYKEPDSNLRRSKRQMTTICVEIKPSGPQEEPYFMCKGADLLNGANSGEGGTYGNAPAPPPTQSIYGGNNFQNPGNDNLRPSYAKPSATQNEGYSGLYSNGQNYNEPFENKQDGYSTPNQPETSKQNQPSYKPFSQVVNNFQVPTKFPPFKSFFPASSKSSPYLPPNPSPAYESIYDKQDGQSGQEPTQPSTNYGNNNKNKPASDQESPYDNAPNPYATGQSGYGSSYNNGGEGNQQAQSGNPGPSTNVAGGGQQPSNSPFSLNAFDARVAANPTATTSQPFGDPTLSYANSAGPQRPGSQYATRPGSAAAAAPYVAPAASKPSPLQPTFMSTPISAKRPQVSPPSYSSAIVGASREQQQLPMPISRHRAVLDEDVLDMPDIGFTHSELRQFQRTPQQRAMLRIPDRNSFQQSLINSPTPRPGVRISVPEPIPTSRRGGFPTTQMMSQARAYYDDPIIRTFYGLDEPTNPFPSDNLVGQAYPIYPAQPSNPLPNQQQQQQPNGYQQTSYNQQQPDYNQQQPEYNQPQPDYNPQQPDYNQQLNDYQQPIDYPKQQQLNDYNQQPNFSKSNYNQPPVQSVQPIQPPPVLYNSYGPRLDDPMGCFSPPIQKPPQQCFAGSDNGPIYTPPSTPSSCSMDYNIQPIFIAIPCYGQPPQSQPQAQVMSRPMYPISPPSSPNPIVGGPLGLGGPFGGLGGGPLGFGLFHPLGFGGLRPFGGLLGSQAQKEPAQPDQASLGTPYPLGRFNLTPISKMFTTEPAVQQETSEAPRRTSNTKPNVLNFSTDVPQMKINKQDEAESAENANADTSQEEIDDPTAMTKQTESIVGAAFTTPSTLNTTKEQDSKKSNTADTSIFSDSNPNSEEHAEANLSAKSLLDLAEAKLEKPTNNTETRSGDVRKRHNVKQFLGIQKRKYLQKL